MANEIKFDPSDLDFQQIMNKMKTYFESSGQFNDYDFDGSAMQALMRVLAWNTHQNALIANMATNEAFLDTAQLRSSVVSHAKPLGYLPRSRRSATARIRVALQNVPNGTADVTIPRWSAFTTSIDNITYTFYTTDDALATAANNYTVDVDVYEGKKLRKRFVVDSDSYPTYVIPNSDLDTSTMLVTVKAGLNTTVGETYTRPTKIEDLNPEQENYFLYESPNGYYEITLGDDLIGKKPPAGSVVDVDYLKSAGPAANGAKSFTTSLKFGTFTPVVTTLSNSTGGSLREDIESIRFNAPKAFGAQNRAVTVNDYKTFILSEANFIETLNIWGGEDNDPPEYGKVFICAKPTGADALTAAQKTQLKDVILAPRAVLTIENEIVDPKFEYLEIRMTVNYDPNKTTLSKTQLENQLKATILEYGDINLASFDSAFRKSRLLAYVDDSEQAVLTVSADVYLQRRLFPTLNTAARYDLNFTAPIASVSAAEHIVNSTPFNYVVNGVSYVCTLRNKTNSTQLEIVRPTSNGVAVVVDDAGYIDTQLNKLVLLPFRPSNYPDQTNGIRFTVLPLNQNNVKPQRDLLIKIDPDRTSVTAIREE